MSSRRTVLIAATLFLACNRTPVGSESSAAEGTGESSTNSDGAVETSASTTDASQSGATGDPTPGTDWSDSEQEGEEADSGDSGTYFDHGRPLPDVALPACDLPHRGSMTIEGSLSPSSCSTPSSYSGRVMDIGPDTLVVDACPCDMDCFDEDPQTYDLTIDDVAGDFFSTLSLGECVSVHARLDCESSGGLEIVAVDTPESECGLAFHWSKREGNSFVPEPPPPYPWVDYAYEGGESCFWQEAGALIELGELAGTVGDFDFAVGHTFETDAGGCENSLLSGWAYRVNGLSAVHTASALEPQSPSFLGILVRRQEETIPPP